MPLTRPRSFVLFNIKRLGPDDTLVDAYVYLRPIKKIKKLSDTYSRFRDELGEMKDLGEVEDIDVRHNENIKIFNAVIGKVAVEEGFRVPNDQSYSKYLLPSGIMDYDTYLSEIRVALEHAFVDPESILIKNENWQEKQVSLLHRISQEGEIQRYYTRTDIGVEDSFRLTALATYKAFYDSLFHPYWSVVDMFNTETFMASYLTPIIHAAAGTILSSKKLNTEQVFKGMVAMIEEMLVFNGVISVPRHMIYAYLVALNAMDDYVTKDRGQDLVVNLEMIAELISKKYVYKTETLEYTFIPEASSAYGIPVICISKPFKGFIKHELVYYVYIMLVERRYVDLTTSLETTIRAMLTRTYKDLTDKGRGGETSKVKLLKKFAEMSPIGYYVVVDSGIILKAIITSLAKTNVSLRIETISDIARLSYVDQGLATMGVEQTV